MNKDEILMKSRQEYQKEAEREIYITTQGFMYGAVGMAIVFFILVFIKLFLKEQRIDDILAMYAAFLFAHYVYKYRMDKVHKNIYPMLCWGICVILNLIVFIWKG